MKSKPKFYHIMLPVLATFILLIGVLAMFQALGQLRAAHTLAETLNSNEAKSVALLLQSAHKSVAWALLAIPAGAAMLAISLVGRIRGAAHNQPHVPTTSPQNQQEPVRY